MDAFKRLGKKIGVGLLVLALNNLAIADTITYFHNDISGSPLAATDVAGGLLWKENYKPYGDKLNRSAPSSSNKIGYHGKAHDDATGLSYMGARYYDPVLGRFMGIDPVDFQTDNLHSFNRYTYANNNPYKYVDPDGRMPLLLPVFNALLALASALTVNAMLNGSGGKSGDGFSLGSSSGSDIGNPSSWSSGRVHNEQDSTNSGDGAKTGDNTNPYKGPVDQPVVVVDEHGNAIPINPGEQVKGSPNGDYQQVLGPGGKPTGDRLDRGGHKNQNDPRAQGPHGHRPGVTTPDGNPHLPIYY